MQMRPTGPHSLEAFRVTVFGDPRGPWRPTWREAFRDAIKLGLASWDESQHEHYLAVPVDIERRAETTP